jgi:hypothetical protein
MIFLVLRCSDHIEQIGSPLKEVNYENSDLFKEENKGKCSCCSELFDKKY